MAVTSGTVYSGYARSSRLYVSWRQTGQSIDGNYTDISWTAGIAVGGSNEWYNNAVKITSIYINGSKVSSGGTYSNIIGNGTYQKLSGTARIPHGTDGSKSFSISVAGWFYGSGNVSGNATFELTPIPRATTPTLSLDSVELGSPVVISMPRAVDTFYHELTYEIGSVSESIGTNLGTSKEWTPPVELASQIPTSVSGSVLINCKTYNSSGTLLGTKSLNLGVTVPDEIVPVINDITIAEAVLKIDEAFGLFIKTQSQLNVEIDAAGVYGSSINRYSSTLDGVNYMQQAFTSNVINTSGQLQLKVEVTDSRGRTAEKIEPVEVVDYSMPAILSMEYYYCDSSGTRNSAGENTKVIIKYKFASVEENNTRALKLSYKKTTEETYIERSVALDAWEGTAEVIIAGTDSSVTYEYIAQPSDKINSPEGMRMTTGIVVLSRKAGGTGVTIGGEAEKDGFVVANGWDALFTGDLFIELDDETLALWEEVFGTSGGVVHLLDLVFHKGYVIPTTNSKFDPNTIFPWMTWERFAKGRTLVGVDEDDEDFATAGIELGEKKHKLTIDELAEHAHSVTGKAQVMVPNGSYNAVMYNGGQTSSYTGGDQPHNNIQPSTTVYYWRRVS